MATGKTSTLSPPIPSEQVRFAENQRGSSDQNGRSKWLFLDHPRFGRPLGGNWGCPVRVNLAIRVLSAERLAENSNTCFAPPLGDDSTR